MPLGMQLVLVGSCVPKGTQGRQNARSLQISVRYAATNHTFYVYISHPSHDVKVYKTVLILESVVNTRF